MDTEHIRQKPDAWKRALIRYEGAWGGTPDFDDPTDCWCFLDIIREQVREEMSHEIAGYFREATARLKALDAPRQEAP